MEEWRNHCMPARRGVCVCANNQLQRTYCCQPGAMVREGGRGVLMDSLDEEGFTSATTATGKAKQSKEWGRGEEFVLASTRADTGHGGERPKSAQLDTCRKTKRIRLSFSIASILTGARATIRLPARRTTMRGVECAWCGGGVVVRVVVVCMLLTLADSCHAPPPRAPARSPSFVSSFHSSVSSCLY